MPENAQKIILFDIDGTLLTCRGAGQKAMEAALTQTFGLQPPFSKIPCAGRTDRGICSTLFETFAISDSDLARTQFRESYLQNLPEYLGSQKAKLLPGVVPLLDELQHHPEIVLSILTGNYQAAAGIKLDHFEIKERFQNGVYGDHHEERNRLAHDAVKLFSKNRNQPLLGSSFLIVGDTPADIHCARAIGASVIAVATGIHDEDTLAAANPDRLLSDLNDTPQAAEAILRFSTD